MTVNNLESFIIHLGDGVNVEFPTTDFSLNSSEEVVVLVRDLSTEVDVVLEDSEYSIPSFTEAQATTITYPVTGDPLPTGYAIVILRSTSLLQLTKITNQTNYNAVVTMAVWDKIHRILQEHSREFERAILMPAGTAGITLPTPTPGAALVGNGEGTAWVNGTPASATLLAGDHTFQLPTDHADLQSAFDTLPAIYVVQNGAEAKLSYEPGHLPATGVELLGGEWANWAITSIADTVTLDATFPTDEAFLHMVNATGLTLDTVVDMQGLGNNGAYVAQGASLNVTGGSGFTNAGANGDNPNGAGMLVLGGRVNVEYTTDGSAQGVVLDGAAKRGVWATIGGTFAGKFGSYRNIGTDPAISEGHACAFTSRNGMFYDDNCDMTGSVRGIRNGGGMSQVRDGDLADIAGHAVWTFLGGITRTEQSSFARSGYNGDYSVYGSNYASKANIATEETNVTDILLNGDGSKLFTIGADGDNLVEYALPSLYNLGGMTFTASFSVSGEETVPTGFDFRSDGQRLAVVGNISGMLHRYNLATGYDLTSTVTLIESVDITAWVASPQAIRISDDQLKCFILVRDGSLYEFALLSAFTFTGMTLTQVHDFSAYGSDMRAMDFGALGSRLCIMDRTADNLLEFDLTTPFDLTTASYERYDWLRSEGAGNGYDAGTVHGFCYGNSANFFFVGESGGIEYVFKYDTHNYPVLYVGGASTSRAQGGGTIIAESGGFGGAKWTIAEVDTAAGMINIDDASGGALLGPVATISGGLVSAKGANFTADADNTAEYMVLVSDAGEWEGTGGTLNGGGTVPHLVAVTHNAVAHLRGTILLGAADTVFDFLDGGGAIYLENNTIDGVSGLFPDGVVLGDNAAFTTRAEAVLAVSLGFTLVDGKTFTAEGVTYMFDASATAIVDMPGVTVPTSLMLAEADGTIRTITVAAGALVVT